MVSDNSLFAIAGGPKFENVCPHKWISLVQSIKYMLLDMWQGSVSIVWRFKCNIVASTQFAFG